MLIACVACHYRTSEVPTSQATRQPRNDSVAWIAAPASIICLREALLLSWFTVSLWVQLLWKTIKCVYITLHWGLSSRHLLFVNALKCTMTMYVEQTNIAMAPSSTFIKQRQERKTVAAAVAVKPVRNIQQIHWALHIMKRPWLTESLAAKRQCLDTTLAAVKDAITLCQNKIAQYEEQNKAHDAEIQETFAAQFQPQTTTSYFSKNQGTGCTPTYIDFGPMYGRCIHVCLLVPILSILGPICTSTHIYT